MSAKIGAITCLAFLTFRLNTTGTSLCCEAKATPPTAPHARIGAYRDRQYRIGRVISSHPDLKAIRSMSALRGGFNGSLQHRVQSIGRRLEAQGLSRTLV